MDWLIGWFGQSVSQPVSQLVGWPVSQLVSQSVCQVDQLSWVDWVCQSVSQSVGQLVGWSVSQSVIWSDDWSVGQPGSQSVGQVDGSVDWVSHSVSQLVVWSGEQSVNQLLIDADWLMIIGILINNFITIIWLNTIIVNAEFWIIWWIDEFKKLFIQWNLLMFIIYLIPRDEFLQQKPGDNVLFDLEIDDLMNGL